MQEGRAREDEILLRLTTITNAASSAVEQHSSLRATKSETGLASSSPSNVSLEYSKIDQPLPVDVLSYSSSNCRRDKLLGLKIAQDKSSEDQGLLPENQVQARATTKKSGKSKGGVHQTRNSLAHVEANPIKESAGNQEIVSGWRSKCDLVFFPHSAVQVRHNDVCCFEGVTL